MENQTPLHPPVIYARQIQQADPSMFRVLGPVSPVGIASDGWLSAIEANCLLMSCGFKPRPQQVPKISCHEQ